MKDTLDSNDVKKLLTLPSETLIIAKRQHYFVLFIKILSILTLFAISSVGIWILFYILQIQSTLQIITYLMTASILLDLIIKSYIDWYFHIYIVTDRKILEVVAIPFYSDVVNNVFLDQVRTTEVDASVTNLVEEILNLGNVTIAFDRPSHDELFVMQSVSDPCETAMKLGDSLEGVMNSSPVWFKRGDYPEQLKFTEDIFSAKAAVG